MVGHNEPVELLDVQGGLWALQTADRANHLKGVDDLHRIVAQRGDEKIAAPRVVAEVVYPSQDSRQNDAGPRSKGCWRPVRIRRTARGKRLRVPGPSRVGNHQ